MMPKLLLADDSITVQRVIALTFQGEGIEVIAVGDGDLAVDAIDRERPQIVLADLSMPGRDGYAVAEYVKRSPELSKDIRVVLLTGAAEPVEEARSRALGIDGVLSKPFEPHVATALVRRLLTERPTIPGVRTATPEDGRVDAAGPAAPEAAGDPSPAIPAATPAAGNVNANAIAVDDYFRRLDEALATAGLSTAPESAADLAAIVGQSAPAVERPAVERPADAETIIVTRRAPAAPAAADAASADEPGDAPKLVDAFSALLAAEEGDDRATVAGSVEMEGAPARVPPPALEWTSAPAAVTVEAAADTVALQAVTADALEAAEAPVAGETRAAVAPAETIGEAETAPRAATGPVPVISAEVASADTVAADAAAETPRSAAPAVAGLEIAPAAASSPPAALRADAPGHPALEGVDLDMFADAVAQKILHRLTDARIDAIVSERVLEIAERLVREEIDRIKADVQ